MRRLVNIGSIKTVQQLAKSAQNEFDYIEKLITGTTSVPSTANSHPAVSASTVISVNSVTRAPVTLSLVGTKDGSNVSFVIPTKFVAGSEQIFFNGQRMFLNDYYTINGQNVTITGSQIPNTYTGVPDSLMATVTPL